MTRPESADSLDESYERGCQEKSILPTRLSERERDGFSCIQPDLRWRISRRGVTQTGHSQSTVSLAILALVPEHRKNRFG